MVIDERTFNQNLGRRLRAARKRKGMKQDRLAELLDIGRTAVVMIEKGEQRVHAHLLVGLADALGSPVMDLLGLTESKPVSPTSLSLPQSERARDWVLGGLRQPTVVPANNETEGGDGDARTDQG